jgi:hypothetical protein
MAVDMFLKLEGVNGEVTYNPHTKDIDAPSRRWAPEPAR